jgi:hypothetical protein
VAAAERLTGVWPCGHSSGWELTKSWGKGRGAPGGCHRGWRGAWTTGGEPATVGNKWVKTELDGRVILVQMERADARNGNVVWRRCSRVPFIGRGW